MSRTQHLPLYSAAYIFTREIYRARVELPKTLKFGLAQDAFQSAIKILKCIVIANQARDKAPHVS